MYLYIFTTGRHILIAHHLCIVVVVLFELYSLSWVMQSMSNLRHGIHILPHTNVFVHGLRRNFYFNK